jgi:G3E family GTPase
MKTTIVCGLLGAGKTTFIQHFVRDAKGKVVVLVNDFGKAGIDGEIFSAGGVESVELPSGCVCCTLKFDLITTIKKIMETLSPDHLLIEPSGIASPSGVLEALESLDIHPVTIIAVVDAMEFAELNHADAFGRFFEDQITNADIVLVNKVDLAGGSVAADTVTAIERMNPAAIVFQTVKCVSPAPIPDVSGGKRRIDRHAPHFHFDTLSLRISEVPDLESFSGFFQELTSGRYGDIVRAKALLNTSQGPYRFDLSFSRVLAVPFEKPVAGSRLVVIGRDLKRDLLDFPRR